jgi:hypothetical protein
VGKEKRSGSEAGVGRDRASKPGFTSAELSRTITEVAVGSGGAAVSVAAGASVGVKDGVGEAGLTPQGIWHAASQNSRVRPVRFLR